MNLNALYGVIPCCVGIFLTLLGIFFWSRTKNFIGKAQQAKGTIVDLQYDSDSEGSGYYSVFKFKTINGQDIQKTSNIRTNPPQHKVGQAIDVLYDPANPNDARINSTTNLYFVPLLLGGMGIIFFCSGIIVAIFLGMGGS